MFDPLDSHADNSLDGQEVLVGFEDFHYITEIM